MAASRSAALGPGLDGPCVQSHEAEAKRCDVNRSIHVVAFKKPDSGNQRSQTEGRPQAVQPGAGPKPAGFGWLADLGDRNSRYCWLTSGDLHALTSHDFDAK